jgi:hypothetical protein
MIAISDLLAGILWILAILFLVGTPISVFLLRKKNPEYWDRKSSPDIPCDACGEESVYKICVCSKCKQGMIDLIKRLGEELRRRKESGG